MYTKGPSTYHVINKGGTFYRHLQSTKTSKLSQQALRERLVEFLVFNSAFGRHRNWLQKNTSSSFHPMVTTHIWVVTSRWHDDVLFSICPRLNLPLAEFNNKNSTTQSQRACRMSFCWSSRFVISVKSVLTWVLFIRRLPYEQKRTTELLGVLSLRMSQRFFFNPNIFGIILQLICKNC